MKIRLSRNLIRDINSMCQYYIDNTDGSLTQDYEDLRDMTAIVNNRIALAVQHETRVPISKDVIVNVLVMRILDLVEIDSTKEMDALLNYITYKYYRVGYFDNDPYLASATTVESLEYIVNALVEHEQ